MNAKRIIDTRSVRSRIQPQRGTGVASHAAIASEMVLLVDNTIPKSESTFTNKGPLKALKPRKGSTCSQEYAIGTGTVSKVLSDPAPKHDVRGRVAS